MELKLKDICEMLQVSEKTVYRWIECNKIPAYKINYQYRFKKDEIEEWISKNKVLFSKKEIVSESIPVEVSSFLNKGGIFYDIPGNTVAQILENSLSQIPIPESLKKETLLQILLQREEMMPTAIGRGFAIPHARNPIVHSLEEESLSICFLKEPVNYGALDRKPVDTLFVLLSSLPKRHVEMLSKISHLCQQNDFVELLKRRAPQTEIFSYLQNKEKKWKERKMN